MRDESLWPGFYILIHIKQDFRLVICLFMCITPSDKYFYTCRTKTSLPEMRSEGTLWKKKHIDKIKGDKPRCVQLMVLMLLPRVTFMKPSKGIYFFRNHHFLSFKIKQFYVLMS